MRIVHIAIDKNSAELNATLTDSRSVFLQLHNSRATRTSTALLAIEMDNHRGAQLH